MTAQVVILGGGISGLTAAYELAKRGIRPTVIEARRHLGGLAAGGYVGGVRLDLGAESFALRRHEIISLCDELGLAVKTPQGQSWIWDRGQAAPIAQGIWGIPSTWDDAAFSALTFEEFARARMDLELPAHVGSDSQTLAELVRARLGEGVLQKMVAPVAGGVHTSSPEKLALSAVAPGLLTALRETGSLIAAVQRLRPENKPILGQPIGGICQISLSLAAKIRELGGEIRTGVMATDILREPAGYSILLVDSDGERTNPQPVPGTEEVIAAANVVIALDGPHALALLQKISGLEFTTEWAIPQGAKIAGVTLILRNEELSRAPRGSGVLIEAGGDRAAGLSVQAKAFTHYSVKWEWAAQALQELHGEHTHAIRLSYGRSPDKAPYPAVKEALEDAQTVLDIELNSQMLIDSRIVHWGASLSPHSPTHRDNLENLQAQLAQIPNLALTGAWVAGTGLGAVIPHAMKIGASFAEPS